MSLKDDTPKGIYEPNTDYRVSLIPIRSKILFSSLFFFLFLAVFENHRHPSSMIQTILIGLLLILLLVPFIYDRKPTAFEKSRQRIKDAVSPISLDGFEYFFSRILLYADGIEIRAFYTAYFIPFGSIRNIHFDGRYITIQANLESVPQAIKLNPREPDSLFASIQNTMGSAGAGRIGKSDSIPSSIPKEMESDKAGRTVVTFGDSPLIPWEVIPNELKAIKQAYNKRYMTYIGLCEIALILIIGPSIMFFRYVTFHPTETKRLYSHNAYTPADPSDKSRIYRIVEVTYDENQEVVRERYYDVLGTITTRDRSRESSSFIYVTDIILFILIVAGGIVIGMGYRRDEKYKPHGWAILLSSLIALAIKQFVGGWMYFLLG